MLIKDLRPKEKPDERFYKAMEPLWSIGNNLNQLTAKAHSLNFIDAPMLEDTVKKLNHFITAVEEEFLAPEKVGGANDRD